MQEEDNGTLIEGRWVRRFGYSSEFDVDFRWILYYPNDERPHGSLRIVSHPDLPPGHLKSFVSIITKRWPKTKEDFAKTFQNYGLLDENDLFFYKGSFFKEKNVYTYFFFNNKIYKKRTYSKINNKIVASYNEPTTQNEILKGKVFDQTPIINDEFSVIIYSNPLSDAEIINMLKSLTSELESYSIDENVESWENELVDKVSNLEKIYNIKIFE